MEVCQSGSGAALRPEPSEVPGAGAKLVSSGLSTRGALALWLPGALVFSEPELTPGSEGRALPAQGAVQPLPPCSAASTTAAKALRLQTWPCPSVNTRSG